MAKKINRQSDVVNTYQEDGQFILMGRADFLKWITELEVEREITLLQQHHTYIPNYDNFDGDNHFSLGKAMKRSHLKRGFSDIAQNITTYPDGTIMICRDFETKPAGIKGKNFGALCLEHVGHFDLDCDEITKEHEKTILFVNAVLCMKFNLKPSAALIYHTWYASKSCPGTNFFGGNTREDCAKNFVPMVESMMEVLDA